MLISIESRIFPDVKAYRTRAAAQARITRAASAVPEDVRVLYVIAEANGGFVPVAILTDASMFLARPLADLGIVVTN